MASFTAGDIIKVVSRLKFNNANDIQNAWHFVAFASATIADNLIRPAVEGWLDGVFDSLSAMIATLIDPYDLKVDKVTWNPALQREQITENLYFGPWTMASAPTASSESLPLQCAPIINMRTVRPQSRGRKFFPPFTETQSDTGGGISASGQANLALAAADMLDILTIDTTNFIPGVISPYSGVYANFLPFSSGTVTPQYCTQRRRRINVGS